MVDRPVPDTAMDTKSEQGDPGGADAVPLTDDERALLDRLRTDRGTTGTPPIADTRGAEQAAEESPEYAAAVDDDTPLPGAPPAADRPDPLDPIFREPSP